MGNVAIKVDCTACGQTGYSNYYTRQTMPAYYIPGAIKRWRIQRGGMDFPGESAIKVDAIYADVLEAAQYIEFNGKQWQFTMIRDPGAAMGQERIIIALNRKA